MFADDTKVFKTITSPNNQHTLENDLDYLTSWSSKWLLRIHPDKCNLMHVGKTIQQECAYNLKIYNTAHELGGIEKQKDIGVIIDSNLEFDKHMNQKINKANSIAYEMARPMTKCRRAPFAGFTCIHAFSVVKINYTCLKRVCDIHYVVLPPTDL